VARRRQRRRLRPGGIPDAVVLDSSALSEAAAGQVRVRAELSLAEELGIEVHVSSVTLTETIRGHRRDARIHSVLSGTNQKPVTPQLGRAAGELLGRTNRDDTIDAIVAVTAETLGTRVRLLTGDPDDLNALTADMANVMVVAI
jgi:predicted nucleic acid-binding protein